jgi:hypothetical protein
MYFNRHNDRGPEATSEAIIAWQSGHRPLQRATTYGLDGAFPHQLQSNLLRLYAQASEHWHRFLGFGSAITGSRPSFQSTELVMQAIQPGVINLPKRQPLSEISQARMLPVNAQQLPGYIHRNSTTAYESNKRP